MRRKDSEMQVKVIGGIILLMSIKFMPSLALLECWKETTSCLDGKKTWSEFRQECCGSFLQQISTEKECFCSIKPFLVQNASYDAIIAKFLYECHVTTSFHSICPGTHLSSETPLPSPSTGGFGSSKTPAPSPTKASLSPIETPLRSPSPGTNLSPIEAPLPQPSKQQDVIDCWRRIENCTRTSSSGEVFECCPFFIQEITNERKCYCFIKDILHDHPLIVTSFPQLFKFCSIPTSFEELCPGPLISNQADILPPISGPSLSPSGALFPPGSLTDPSETLFSPPPGSHTSDDENGSCKIIFSVGLLLPQALLIFSAIMMS